VKRALSMIRPEPHYRSDAVISGLRQAGYHVTEQLFDDPTEEDCLVIWNRYSVGEEFAKKFEHVGAMVIVIENGYLGHHYDKLSKAYDPDDNQLYAMALNYHNGAGRWWAHYPDRWKQQGIELQPWRCDGEHVLVLPQRGIGPKGVAMPRFWDTTIVARLQNMTKRPIKVRGHPGNEPATVPLAKDFENCWAAVTWGSGAALKALCAGIPVFHDFKKWIGSPSACLLEGKETLENKHRHSASRERMLERLAWAQWSVPEIESGVPFIKLESVHRGETL
jgi:hypothetical protein